MKELKLDFGGNTLPCSRFKANEVYFLISALSCNLLALMRQLLPDNLASHRAPLSVRILVRPPWRDFNLLTLMVNNAKFKDGKQVRNQSRNL